LAGVLAENFTLFSISALFVTSGKRLVAGGSPFSGIAAECALALNQSAQQPAAALGESL